MSSVFCLSHDGVGRAGTRTVLSVLRIEITRNSASVPPGELGDGPEAAVSELDAKAVSMRVSSEISRIVMNLCMFVISMSFSYSSRAYCSVPRERIDIESRRGWNHFKVSASTNIQRLSRSSPRFVTNDFLIEMPRHDFMG